MAKIHEYKLLVDEEKIEDIQDLERPHSLKTEKYNSRLYILNLALIVAVILSFSLNILQLSLYKLNLSPTSEDQTGTYRSKYGMINILVIRLRERH